MVCGEVIKMESIADIMLKEHAKLEAGVIELERIMDHVELKECFSKLKWNLDKHFFVEEKVIFNVLDFNNEVESEEIERILKDHKDIMWSIKKIGDAFDEGLRPDLSDLREELKAHSKFEDSIFYPKLDEGLDEKLKKVVMDRTGEILRG